MEKNEFTSLFDLGPLQTEEDSNMGRETEAGDKPDQEAHNDITMSSTPLLLPTTKPAIINSSGENHKTEN